MQQGKNKNVDAPYSVFIACLFLIAIFVPLSLFADTGPHQGGSGCLLGEQEITCSTSYGKGCEPYLSSPDYYTGRWESHGVRTDYLFCKEKKSLESAKGLPGFFEYARTSDGFLFLLKISGLVLLACISFTVLLRMKNKK